MSAGLPGRDAPLFAVREEHTFTEAAAGLGLTAKELDEEIFALHWRLERAPFFLTYRVPGGGDERLAFTTGQEGVTYRVLFEVEPALVTLISIAVTEPDEEAVHMEPFFL